RIRPDVHQWLKNLCGLPSSFHFGAASRVPLRQMNPSRLDLINPNLRRSLAESRHSEIKLVELQREQTSARAGRRGNSFQRLVVIDVALLDHVNESLAAGSVNSPARPVVKQVIGVA